MDMRCGGGMGWVWGIWLIVCSAHPYEEPSYGVFRIEDF